MPTAATLGARLWSGAVHVLEPAPDLEVWEWAVRHLSMSSRVTPFPGPVRFDQTPYMTGDWSPLWAYRRYNSIDCIWAAQVGKTFMLQLTVAYDSAVDPGPGMIVYPDAVTARKRSRKHLIPFLADCLPDLVADPQDLQLFEYMLTTCSWVVAWAGSPSALAGEPVKHLKLDEEGKFAGKTDREADAKRLALRRLIAFGEFGNSFCVTTPSLENLPGWRDWPDSTQCQLWVPCPACEHEQVMYFNAEHRTWFEPADTGGGWSGGVKWDRAGELSREQRADSAYYECEACGAHWADGDINRAVSRGRWQARNPDASRYASNLASWAAPWVRLREVVNRWFDAYKDEAARHDFMNSDLAVPYRPTGRKVDANELKARLTLPGLRGGRVPNAATVLVMTADVHDDHLRYRVRGWGHDLTSWGIAEGVLPPNLSALDGILRREFVRADGDRMPVAWALIDSGWRTDEVYQYCLRHEGRVFPARGEGGDEPVRYTRQMVVASPEKGQYLEGEVVLARINDSRYKDLLFSRWAIRAGDPGAWYVEEEASASYWAQLAGEVKVTEQTKKGRPVVEWRQIGDNHALDCEKMQLAATTIFTLGGGHDDLDQPAADIADVINPYTGRPAREWNPGRR